MAQEEITQKILEERIQLGIEIIQRLAEKNKKKLTDCEVMDLGTRLGQSLFIEKNKQFHMSQIKR